MLFCLAQFDRNPPWCSKECLETYDMLRSHSILGNEPIPYEDRPNIPMPDPNCTTCKGQGRYSPYDEQQTEAGDFRTCECWRYYGGDAHARASD